MKTKLQYSFLALILIVWISLGVHSPYFTKDQLSGVTDNQEFPNWDWNDFKEGKFQKHFEIWYQQQGLFRSLLIQIDNSVLFYIYNQEKTGSNLVKGKQSTLFYRQDIDFFNQERHLSDSAISQLNLLKKIQTQFLERKQLLVPVIVPSKTTVSTEFIPESWKLLPNSKGDSIYHELIAELQKRKIFYVDAREILLEGQKKKLYQAFPKYARHWSRYSSCFVFHKILSEFKRLDLNEFDHHCTKENSQKTSNDLDNLDLLRLSNILGLKNIEDDTPTLPQINLKFDTSKTNGRDGMVVVASSFGFFFQFEATRTSLFKNPYFFYYNKTIYDESKKIVEMPAQSEKWKKTIDSSALIIVDLFETFLPDMHEDFFLQAEEHLQKSRH